MRCPVITHDIKELELPRFFVFWYYNIYYTDYYTLPQYGKYPYPNMYFPLIFSIFVKIITSSGSVSPISAIGTPRSSTPPASCLSAPLSLNRAITY